VIAVGEPREAGEEALARLGAQRAMPRVRAEQVEVLAGRVADDASAPPGCSARATRSSRAAGSIQWNAVAETTASNGSSGSGQSSKAAVTTSAAG